MVTENMEQYKGVFIYAQQVDGEISPIAFELLGKAKDLAADLDTDVTAVLLGSKIKALQISLPNTARTELSLLTIPFWKFTERSLMRRRSPL